MSIPSDHRCGFAAVVGRPNVGKSTLVNRILGRELSIVTPKPQTTRNRVTGIHSLPHAQLILQDTPGLHDAKTPLNKALVTAAVKALQESDLILFVVEPLERIPDEDERSLVLLNEAKVPTVLAINKIDTVRPPALLPIIEAYSARHAFQEIIPISAITGAGIEELIEALVKRLPLSPPLFPEDDLSDLPLRFFAAEIVREQVMKTMGQEIPYKTAVVVEEFLEQDERVVIRADIHVERDSHKKMIIGKKGEIIKKIGIQAREKLEDFLETRVRLELFVKVTPHWTRDPRMLKEFGYQ